MDRLSKRAASDLTDREVSNVEIDKLKYVMALSRISDHLEAAKREALNIDEPMLAYIIKMGLYELGSRFVQIGND